MTFIYFMMQVFHFVLLASLFSVTKFYSYCLEILLLHIKLWKFHCEHLCFTPCGREVCFCVCSFAHLCVCWEEAWSLQYFLNSNESLVLIQGRNKELFKIIILSTLFIFVKISPGSKLKLWGCPRQSYFA